MAKPLSINVKANIIGIAALAITGVYLIYDLTHTESIEPCSQSYPPSIALNVDLGDGEVLSSAALQARSGSQDWGVIDKVSIETAGDASVPHVFKVALPKGDISSKRNTQGGAGFPWRPSQLDGATSVCLAFDVWVPEDFDFSAGGILPGIATELRPQTDAADGGLYGDESWTRKLRSHLSWSNNGTLQAIAFEASPSGLSEPVFVRTDAKLQPGRWHQIQNEVVLNKAGEDNGTVRLWLDGTLVGAKEHLSLRTTDDIKFETVLYHISRGAPVGNASKAMHDDSALRLSPVALSWRE